MCTRSLAEAAIKNLRNIGRSIRTRIAQQTKPLRFQCRLATASLRQLPSFLIIGAQKSGTTSLYSCLTQHPRVESAFEKEVRYFNNHFHRGVNWYKAHFPLGPGRRVISGEGEPSYLPNPIAAERVRELVPSARFVVMLRNPVDRAYSHYHHRHTRGQEKRTFEEVCEADMEVLKDGWAGLPTADYVRLGHLHYSYLPRGFYYEQLKTWMDVFPRDQFLIVRAEDFFADSQAVFDDVLAHLGLPPHRLEQGDKRNVGGYSQSMSDETRARLEAYFRPQNQRLYEFLDRDFGWDAG